MTDATTDAVKAGKESAARAVLDLVEDGMTLGLGSGSTAELFIVALGRRIADEGWTIRGAPTSEASARAATAAGVPLVPIEEVDRLDLDIDGADEVDPAFHLIKGGGGCLLREKIIAAASGAMVVIVDDKKMVPTLGAFPLPVEVDPFGWALTSRHVADALRATNAEASAIRLRKNKDGGAYVTDGGHYILDCATTTIPSPKETAARIAAIPGVVEHGLFINLASIVVIGRPDGAEVRRK